MGIIVNKMDQEKKERKWPTLSKKFRLSTLRRLAEYRELGTPAAPRGPRRSGVRAHPLASPRTRAAPAAAAVCRCDAGPRITLAQGKGPRPGWQPSCRVSANGLGRQKETREREATF